MYYQEITVIPSPEIHHQVVMDRVMQQIHIGLVDVRNKHQIESIGLYFPRYHCGDKQLDRSTTLGDKVRIVAPRIEDLNTLDVSSRLDRLLDYVHVKSIAAVPTKHGFVTVRRYRHHSLHTQSHRLAKRKQITVEEAMHHCLRFKKPRIYPPYAKLRSTSTGNFFKLEILQETSTVECSGTFSVYGLSTEGSTLPFF